MRRTVHIRLARGLRKASLDFFHSVLRRPVAVLSLSALTLGAACGGGEGPTGPDGPAPQPTVRSVTVSPSSLELAELGATRQLEATARDQNGQAVSGVSFTWGSSDESVATVDGDGSVTARGNGIATIRAAASGVTGSADLVVRAGELAWANVSAGLINSCAVTTHRTLYCWGDNVHGQLLREGVGTESRPVPIDAGVTLDRISLGGGQVCGLMGDGTAYCWANGFFGERGDGATGAFDITPDPVSGGHRFAQISAGGNHTCGVTADGTAYCWGRNGEGQLGDGTTTDRLTPAAVAGDLTFVQVSAAGAGGGNHTCGVTTDGAAYCWGPNDDGELGDGTTTERHTPVRVQGDQTFAQVAAGERHTCALTDAGEAYCWGANGAGQLGDGTNLSSTTPVAVAGGPSFVEIGAGQHHTCGRTASGAVYCWGANDAGQLGDGTNETRTTPVRAAGGRDFERIAVDGGHVCGLGMDGTLYCWGLNRSAELGDGTAANRNEPVAVEAPWEGS